MNGKLWISIVVAAVFLGACHDGTSPTGARDLIGDPAHAPAAEGSKYGQAITEDGSNDDTIDPCDIVADYEPVQEPVDVRADSLPGYQHLNAGTNASKYIPPCYEHVTEQNSTGSERNAGNVSKYRPVRRVHITKDQARFDGTNHASMYKPRNTDHVSDSGPNKSKYRAW